MSAMRLGVCALRNYIVRPLFTTYFQRKVGVAEFCDDAGSAEESPKGRVHTEGEMLRMGDIYPDVDPYTSMEYMDSEAYKMAYGKDPVWKHHRRNFKGQFAPETRKMCVRGGVVSTGNPCPVCRDEYLVIHYKNTKLLNQFISPYTGEILPTKMTSICQRQLKKLKVEVEKARDCGYIEAVVPFKKYNYEDYLDVKPT